MGECRVFGVWIGGSYLDAIVPGVGGRGAKKDGGEILKRF